jgi:hypothetical protein
MSAITAELAALLSTVRRPGDFVTAGTIELPAPRLEVNGVGPVALPLLPIQAEQLKANGHRHDSAPLLANSPGPGAHQWPALAWRVGDDRGARDRGPRSNWAGHGQVL